MTGIDLTPGFVAAASELSARAGLADRARFVAGSALDLPFADASFDAATLMHVGMNIADKARLFAEVRRVLRPGGTFGVYEVMRTGDGPLPMPLPWADSEATSFVETPETYRALLAAAGFRVADERDRTDFVLELAREDARPHRRRGPPKLGLHVIMGPDRLRAHGPARRLPRAAPARPRGDDRHRRLRPAPGLQSRALVLGVCRPEGETLDDITGLREKYLTAIDAAADEAGARGGAPRRPRQEGRGLRSSCAASAP